MQPASAGRIPVALLPCHTYAENQLLDGVAACFQAAGIIFRPGDRALVKPNLVAARRAFLSCTHPALVRAVCLYLLDHRVRLQVGDSPAFGSARQVAGASGLIAALRDLNAPIVSLGAPVRRILKCGITVGISRTALEADLICNLPKFKAHGQLFLTGAVKNLFGCVCGVRKAVAHMRHDQGDRLAELILDLAPHLPQTVNLMDAITAMQHTGPVSGIPCDLGLMGASRSALALDTAISAALGIAPEQVPIWRTACAKGLPGSHMNHLDYPLTSPDSLCLPPFQTPARLSPVSFHPWRMALGMARRAWLRLCG